MCIKVVDGREKLLFVRRRVFEKMSEVCGRKRKSDSNSEKKMKKKKKWLLLRRVNVPPKFI